MSHYEIQSTPLGKKIIHSRTYDPQQLCPVPRAIGRKAEGVLEKTYSYFGQDIWNAYDLSWLASSGKPEVAVAEIRIPAESPNLIESKSLKLYLNAFNMTIFENSAAVNKTITRDLSQATGKPVQVKLIMPHQFSRLSTAEPAGTCIDQQHTTGFAKQIDPLCLKTLNQSSQETLFSRLFRSICPVTGQPDFATITIAYQGRRICPEGLLHYIVSFREHAGFHEFCVERIFHDLMQHCKPEHLTVLARFSRRGGIDINPFRSTDNLVLDNLRDPRQ